MGLSVAAAVLATCLIGRPIADVIADKQPSDDRIIVAVTNGVAATLDAGCDLFLHIVTPRSAIQFAKHEVKFGLIVVGDLRRQGFVFVFIPRAEVRNPIRGSNKWITG